MGVVRLRQMLAWRPDAGLILALVLGAFAYIPLLADPGLVNTRAGGDSPFLLVRLHQMATALRDGVFPVRWMPDAAYGLGYPFFNFYAPLPYYLAAGLYFLGLSFVGALKTTQVLGFIVASIGMYRLAGELWNSRPAGLLASLAYTYAPFHLVNVYVRGDSLGEFWAFAFYPLVFLAIRQLRTHPSPLSVTGLALSVAGLILSHNISAMIFLPFVFLYIVVHRYTGTQGDREKPCVPVSLGTCVPVYLFTFLSFAGLALGLALSAWYWVPALQERSAVQIEQNLTGYFFYGEHFRDENLIQRDWLFNYTISRRQTPFALGLVQAASIGLGLLVIGAGWLRRRRIEPESAAIVTTLFLATALITPLSRPVWDHVPLLAFAQFPWRILSVVAFAGSLVTGAMTKSQIPNPKTQNWSLRFAQGRLLVMGHGALAIGLGALLAGSVLLPLRVDYLPITAADVSPERLALYELFTGNIGSTARTEYLPRGVDPRPFTSPWLLNAGQAPTPVVLEGQLATAELVEQRAATQRWRVEVTSPQASLAFPVYAFPGWGTRVDGRPALSQPASGLGYLSTVILQGEHTVDLAFGHTPIRLVSELLGLATLLLLLAGLIWARRQQLQGRLKVLTPAQHNTNYTERWPAFPCIRVRIRVVLRVVLVLGLFFAFFAAHSVIPRSAQILQGNSVRACTSSSCSSSVLDHPSTLTMDYEVMPYLHPNPNGVRYGNALRLRDYTVSGDPDAFPSGWPSATAGQSFAVTLIWNGASPAGWSAEIALTTPALPLFNVPDVAARAAEPLAPVTRHDLRVPAETTPGLYLLRLEVNDADHHEVSPLSERGSRLGTTYLAPVWITAPPSRPPTATPLAHFQHGFTLERAQFHPLSPEHARVDLVWRTTQAPTANYLTSIRLLDASGTTMASIDHQPLYGFAPTSTWTPGVPIFDRRWLKLPKNLPAGDNYRIQVILYTPGTLQELGRAELPGDREN